MQCNKCATLNEDDSRFCKRCGQYLYQNDKSSIEKPDEHIRVGELIYASYKHKEAGRIDEAILACQGALTLNDQSISAHTLLASLYETRGDFNLAIEEYRKILKIEPDNNSIKEKLAYLDNILLEPTVQSSSSKFDIETIRPYLPAITAVGAMLLVILIGFIIIKMSSNGNSPQATNQNNPRVQQSIQGIPQQGEQYQQINPAYQQQQTYPSQGQIENPQVPQPQVPAATPATQQPNNAPTNTVPRTNNRRGIPSVPLPRMVQPTAIVPHGTSVITPVYPQQPVNNNGSSVIVPVYDNNGQQNAKLPEPPKTAQPSVTYTAPKPAPNSSVPVIQPVQDPEERAMQLQGAGKYDDAINAYHSVLKKTSNKGRVYQQLALSYQRTGRKQQAIDSYRKAIASYKEQLAAGRDASDVQRDIRACEAGIQVSQN
ncbi:MAG: tetratricopeptide repeat protein [Armatimonadota bacterium]